MVGENATCNPQLALKAKIHHRWHSVSQRIFTNICCHSERSEESREHTRGCTRDFSPLAQQLVFASLWMTGTKKKNSVLICVIRGEKNAKRNPQLWVANQKTRAKFILSESEWRTAIFPGLPDSRCRRCTKYADGRLSCNLALPDRRRLR